ncbi:7425_t:CDS:2 [Rhizophagus irregularis]|nr:7425_t:CDS:2 [Rhizophagus irregularis]
MDQTDFATKNAKSLGDKILHPLFALQSAPGGKLFFFDELASLKGEDIELDHEGVEEVINLIRNSTGVCITYNGFSLYDDKTYSNIREGLAMRHYYKGQQRRMALSILITNGPDKMKEGASILNGRFKVKFFLSSFFAWLYGRGRLLQLWWAPASCPPYGLIARCRKRKTLTTTVDTCLLSTLWSACPLCLSLPMPLVIPIYTIQYTNFM